jgi:hypothetical protein
VVQHRWALCAAAAAAAAAGGARAAGTAAAAEGVTHPQLGCRMALAAAAAAAGESLWAMAAWRTVARVA